jgi:hypothetical protein
MRVSEEALDGEAELRTNLGVFSTPQHDGFEYDLSITQK